MSDQWLKCMIFKGMFRDELAIQVADRSGTFNSFFVPRSNVDGKLDEEGKVRVRVFRQGDIKWAVLPTDNPTSIPVKDADLSCV